MDSGFDEYFVQEKTTVDRLLDFLVFIAVFVVTIFLILDILQSAGKFDMQNIAGIYFYVNVGVFVIFVADLIRLWYESHGFKDFVKNSWLDILATIPFGLIAGAIGHPTFEVLKLAKFAKLSEATKVARVSRISKISKEFKAASHLKKEGEEYKQKHRL